MTSLYSLGVTSKNDSDFSLWYWKDQRGAFRHWRFSATSGREAGDPKTCPNFCLWQMAIPTQNATYTAHQIWTKDVWKRTILRRNVFSHQLFSPVPSKSPQNPILGDLSMQNLLYRSHVNGATKVKLYSYIDIGK